MIRSTLAVLLVLAAGCGDGGKAETAKKNAEYRRSILLNMDATKQLIVVAEESVELAKLRLEALESSKDTAGYRFKNRDVFSSGESLDQAMAKLKQETSDHAQSLVKEKERLAELQKELDSAKSRLAESEAELLKYPEQPAK